MPSLQEIALPSFPSGTWERDLDRVAVCTNGPATLARYEFPSGAWELAIRVKVGNLDQIASKINKLQTFTEFSGV